MRKIVFLLLIACVAFQGILAQTKQQKELLLQIAALKVYIEYGQKGYAAVRKGLDFIGDVKKGEVNLHRDYFSSLKKVNPSIKNYVKVGEIVYMQLSIIKTCKRTLKQLHSNDLFHGDELDYVQRSFDRLLANCDATLQELLQVTTDISIEMKDDQRIERIDGLHRTMTDDYAFCQRFSSETTKLSLSRAKENIDVKLAVFLHGL